tara:strand:- start:23 stop:328 length:306 start_codon:yes stop_codon:yes gene_type:complete
LKKLSNFKATSRRIPVISLFQTYDLFDVKLDNFVEQIDNIDKLSKLLQSFSSEHSWKIWGKKNLISHDIYLKNSLPQKKVCPNTLLVCESTHAINEKNKTL